MHIFYYQALICFITPSSRLCGDHKLNIYFCTEDGNSPLFNDQLLIKHADNAPRKVTKYPAVALCKGIHDSRGFWIPPCGFRIPSTGFRIPAQWIPDSKKGWIPNFFFCFNAFLRISFSCSNLAILKDVV